MTKTRLRRLPDPIELEADELGTLRRKDRGDIARSAAPRHGGGYRVVERTVGENGTERKVTEVIALAAGGSAPNSTQPRGNELELAKPSSEDRLAILQKCYELFVSDPLGGQIAETTSNFIFGGGVTVNFADEKADAWAQRFRKRNQMEVREQELGTMSVYQGDIYMWLRPSIEEVVAGKRKIQIPGDTKLTIIDPMNIVGIEHAPDDVNDVFFYYFEYKDVDKGGVQVVKIRPHDKYDPEADASTGCIIHIKFNADPNDPFGNPDFVRIGEWLENYKEYLRDGVVINKLYRSPCYDITIIDGDEEDVLKAISRYRNWRIGSNPVHNDKETWQVLEFTGPNSSQSEARRAILLMIAAGVGFAEYMLADGSNANLASTTTQELPVLKKFQARQQRFRAAFELMYHIVLMNAAVHGDLPESFDDFQADYYWQGTVEMPNLVASEEKDTEGVNTGAIADKYMSRRTAAKRIGLNYDDEMRKHYEDEMLLMEKEEELQKEREKRGLVAPPGQGIGDERSDLDVGGDGEGGEKPQEGPGDKPKPEPKPAASGE